MNRSRLKLVPKREPQTDADDELSFLPPYPEQARYIALANTFLSRNGHIPAKNVIAIDKIRNRSLKQKVS
jgi:hypothetical protein